MEKRPPIPKELERQVLVEAGHRCAIPTCRQIPVEIAHIIPWAKCKEHAYQNLITLCPTCHTRYDRGEIDRQAMFLYKQNLVFLTNRYGDLELRVLRLFARDRPTDEIWLLHGLEILLMYLLEDELLQDTGQTRQVEGTVQKLFKLTQKGRDYIARWLPPAEGN